MRLILLASLTMLAFAANSLLNRLALKDGLIDPGVFAAIRLASGAVALALIVLVQGRALPLGQGRRLTGALALATYMIGFSLAYRALDAGTGALILFGGVQVTMFAGALILGEAVPPRRWAGALMAFGGLAWLLAPGAGAPPPLPFTFMAAAALGWGVYSLAGRAERDALAATTGNFILATPLALAALLVVPPGVPVTSPGVALALLSGVVTSGLGYALWYHILPELGAARAAVAQLSVPLIALFGSLMLLGEMPPARFLPAALLILAGVALATLSLPARGKAAGPQTKS